ncbi:hypothetical protein IWZ03DRAFT_412325 [Phyllosticta citriasiana]|uniref:Xylanolytic transcriptional activator regulatory domain-containing protein n=1 Tax=Phyllosticta citriasiana TaxID=595635 RepID=A0ABR1KVG2_9PEZI
MTNVMHMVVGSGSERSADRSDRFYHLYRSISFPLSPIITDIDAFEIFLGRYLESCAGSDLSVAIPGGNQGAAHVVLLLAILAVGAQISDLSPQERRRVSRDFARPSFHAQRRANFLLRSSPSSLQGLLVLATFLQNDGNSDAAWSTHISFLVSIVCRPTFSNSSRAALDESAQPTTNLAARGKAALADVLRAFVDLQALTIYPLRSWVMIQEVLSSALLLAALGETRKSEQVRQRRLIDVLVSSSSTENSGESAHSLSSSHLRALRTLERLAHGEQPPTGRSTTAAAAATASNENRQPDPGDTASGVVDETSQTGDNAWNHVFDEPVSGVHLDSSPLAFLDSVIWEKSCLDSDGDFLEFDLLNWSGGAQ